MSNVIDRRHFLIGTVAGVSLAAVPKIVLAEPLYGWVLWVRVLRKRRFGSKLGFCTLKVYGTPEDAEQYLRELPRDTSLVVQRVILDEDLPARNLPLKNGGVVLVRDYCWAQEWKRLRYKPTHAEGLSPRWDCPGVAARFG